jgi:hypothetical protein
LGLIILPEDKMAKARKKVKTRKSVRKSRTKGSRRKAGARKASPRKSKARKAPARKSARRRRRKTQGLVETVQQSFEDSAKMQQRAGTRWGTGEG